MYLLKQSSSAREKEKPHVHTSVASRYTVYPYIRDLCRPSTEATFRNVAWRFNSVDVPTPPRRRRDAAATPTRRRRESTQNPSHTHHPIAHRRHRRCLSRGDDPRHSETPRVAVDRLAFDPICRRTASRERARARARRRTIRFPRQITESRLTGPIDAPCSRHRACVQRQLRARRVMPSDARPMRYVSDASAHRVDRSIDRSIVPGRDSPITPTHRSDPR